MSHPIFVTGPQRSGTRIFAHIIAYDTGRTFVDELDYSLNIPMDSVVQCPFLLKNVIETSFFFPTAQFVFMRRNVDDIVCSMERIEWCKDYTTDPDFYRTYVNHCYSIVDTIKYTLSPDRWIEIDYNKLHSHPLFVKDRTGFTSKQHEIDKPVGPPTWRSDEHIRTIKGRLQTLPTSPVESA